MSALEAQNTPEALKLIRSREFAVRYAGLGRTTLAAKHHVTIVGDDEGKQCNKVLRISVSAPQRCKHSLLPKKAEEVPVQTAACMLSSYRVVVPPPLNAARPKQ